MSQTIATTRQTRTGRRRREVLDAALACFTELGFAATTMADVCRRSQASVGSVYHHFGSKEQLAAALFLEGLRDYQQRLLRELKRIDPGRPGSGRRLVRTIVDNYLRWVEGHADWARYLIEFGHAPFIGDVGDELQSMNHEFFSRLEQALAPAVGRGELRQMPRDLTFAVTVGPAREFARRWLRERTETSMAVARRLLPDAACRAIKCPKKQGD
jgi:AcrR family transcriptional regulator